MKLPLARLLVATALPLAACGGPAVDADADVPRDASSRDDAALDAYSSDDAYSADDAYSGDDAGLCGNSRCDPGEDPASCPADCVASGAAALIDDQELVIPGNAVDGDTVGHAKPYPTLTLRSPVFSIAGGDAAGIFAIDPTSGRIEVAQAALLTAPSYDLTVQLRDGVTDTAVVHVRVLPATEVTFIDPSASAAGADGTRAHPFTSWSAVRFTAGRAYLQRRGTIAVTSSSIGLASDTLLGAWGAGARPTIRCEGVEHCLDAYRVGGLTLRDLDIDADGTSAVYFNNGGSSPNVIDACELHGPTWGIRMTGDMPRNVGHRVLYTEIHDIGDDGAFMVRADDLELGYLDVHDVNTHWMPPVTDQLLASGDGLQLGAVNGFRVYRSRLDRSSTGNKFCLIAAGSTDGVIEHNLMTGPISTTEGGASLYLGGDNSAMVVRYNTFDPGAATTSTMAAIWNHAPGTRLYGNVIVGAATGINCLTTSDDAPCEVLHNVFSRCATHIGGSPTDSRVVARNNIFDLRAGDRAVATFLSLTEDHNLFTMGAGSAGSFVGDPRFVDAAGGDFRLQAGSPAIDVGAEVGITLDREGTLIPQGDAPDLGAYELVP